MNAALQFQKDRDLLAWWVAVVHDDRFAKVITHACACLVENMPSTEHLAGARLMVSILETLPESDPAAAPFPSPGLIHDPNARRDVAPPKAPTLNEMPVTIKPRTKK